MDAQKVDMFIMANGKYFAEEKIWVTSKSVWIRHRSSLV